LSRKKSSFILSMSRAVLCEVQTERYTNANPTAFFPFSFASSARLLETGTQVSSLKMILRCGSGTQVDSNLMCEASTQTPKGGGGGGGSDDDDDHGGVCGDEE